MTFEDLKKKIKELFHGEISHVQTHLVAELAEQYALYKLSDLKPSKILSLSLKKAPFEVMVTGEKKTEFRDPSQWILSRLKGQHYDFVKFINGYGSDKPYFIAKYRGYGIETNPYYVEYSNGLIVESKIGTVKIYLGKIVETGNLKS